MSILKATVCKEVDDATHIEAAPAGGKKHRSHMLDKQIETACARIAPLWPLKHFVAVNPFLGLSDKPFQDASDTLARILGHGIYMSRDYYAGQLASARITDEDLQAAIELYQSELDVAGIKRILATKAPQPRMGMAPVSQILEQVEGGLWSSFVTERISLHCAAYFDLGQASVSMPWRDQSLYSSWRKAASIDMSPAMMGLGDFRDAVTRLPGNPRQAIALAVEQLAIPEEAIERYLHASLLSIGGWAAWTRYLRWQDELGGSQDDSIVDLLAIRVMWDLLLYQQKQSSALTAQWRDMLMASMRPPSAKRQAAAEVDRILLAAMENGFQRNVMNSINGASKTVTTKLERPAVQAAFCIDVRSEVYRRSLETVAPAAQTIGFAGFFGIFIEYVPLGADAGCSHVPIIFNPANRIHEQAKGDKQLNSQLVNKRRERIGLAKAWKGFKMSASSCFSFVEAAGLLYAPKLLSDSLGWTRPVANPAYQGLDKKMLGQIGPELKGAEPGIPETEWIDHAERILRAMNMTENFARLVLLAGHGSTTVNNPHATALDCGACAGQTGEASARVVAAIMNQRLVREGLRDRGIRIPGDTWFVAGLHDTTTDQVKLFDTGEVPAELQADLEQLQQWLEQATDLTCLQRAALMDSDGASDMDIAADIRRRASDWSQVRPEWALANNGAFIAAPRSRTRGVNLDGRAFLHEYDWKNDEGFKILELIMTAPMVVANWINMQYYGSVVDNTAFGSGNKVLHNIVGGAIGVLEGNGGDLRVGLPMQSLHNGKEWMHEPLRLSVFIEAPADAIDDIISRHDMVRQLVDNNWLHIFRIDEDGNSHRRLAHASWKRLS